MAVTLLILNLFCLLSILISLGGAHGVNIQAYRYRNFTGKLYTILIKCFHCFVRLTVVYTKLYPFKKIGLIWEGNSTDDCTNIPEDKGIYAYSIRTDTCFIAYTFLNCNTWRSKKYMPGDIVTSSWRE